MWLFDRQTLGFRTQLEEYPTKTDSPNQKLGKVNTLMVLSERVGTKGLSGEDVLSAAA